MIQKSRAITLKDNLESSRRQLFSLRKKIVKEKVLLSDLGDALPVMVDLNTYTGNQYSNAAAETVFRRSKEEIKLMGKKFLDTYFYKQEYLSFERYLEQQVVVLHNDETSIACAGKKLWLHVSTTNEVTHNGVDEKRCKAAIAVATADRIGILPEFTGVSVHDGWKPYFQYRQCQHAFCNAHLLWELIFFAEEEKALRANNIAATLTVARQIVQEAQQKGEDALDSMMLYNLQSLYQADIKFAYEDISPPEPPSLLEELTHQLVGKKLKKCNEQQKLLAHLETYQSEILAFIRDFRIPFDKNLAELDLRMMKAAVATVKQKVSGTFRCNEGAKIFACIRGYVSTVKKQGRNVLEELANALQENPFKPLWNFNTVTFNFTLILAISYCHFTKL